MTPRKRPSQKRPLHERSYLPPELIDWTPLADIKPDIRGGGYSMFTADEGQRIIDFHRSNQVAAIAIARYFGIEKKSIYRILWREIKYQRLPSRAPREVPVYE